MTPPRGTSNKRKRSKERERRRRRRSQQQQSTSSNGNAHFPLPRFYQGFSPLGNLPPQYLFPNYQTPQGILPSFFNPWPPPVNNWTSNQLIPFSEQQSPPNSNDNLVNGQSTSMNSRDLPPRTETVSEGNSSSSVGSIPECLDMNRLLVVVCEEVIKITPDEDGNIDIRAINWEQVAASFPLSARQCRKCWRANFRNHRFSRSPFGLLLMSEDMLRQPLVTNGSVQAPLEGNNNSRDSQPVGNQQTNSAKSESNSQSSNRDSGSASD